MKMIDKFHVFIFFIILSIMIGFVIHNIITNSVDNDIVMVDETPQKFPIRLNKNYEIISAELVDNNLTIIVKDKFSGSEYQSSLPSSELERKICGSYVYRKSYWNCSDKDKLVKSMIMELGYKSIKMINGGV